MQAFTNGIWTAQQKLRFMGLEVGARMTIIDYNGQGDLFIHSPKALTQPLATQLNEIGIVRYVIAPNCLHHLYIQDFKKSYPKAQFLVAPGLKSKRNDLDFAHTLDEKSRYEFSTTLKHRFIAGCPQVNEFVFFHEPTKTLIVADLGLHICEESPPLTRLIFKLMGGFKRFGWAEIEKKLFIRDNTAFTDSIAKVLDWDFDKIIMCHGRLLERNGKELFRIAFS